MKGLTNKLRRSRLSQGLALVMLIPGLVTDPTALHANPSGQVVVHGNVNFQGLGTSTLNITNNSNAAIINWQTFSINQGEVTNIIQGANATTLNRVISGNPTNIYGQLNAANGSVIVVNPNGIVVGAGGSINVAGMLALSTLDIDNQDFLNGGTSRFYGNTQAGVTNFGTIRSSGGDVVLMGGFVDNQGQIGALNGTVALGSGGDILLHEGGGGARITVQGKSDYDGTGVNNAGEISAVSAEMKAHGNVYALAINNGGTVRATGASRSGGRVRLQASGTSSNINLGNQSQIVAGDGQHGGRVEIESTEGTVTVAGRVDATGSVEGGEIAVSAAHVIQEQGSVVDASGGYSAGKVELDAQSLLKLAGEVLAEGNYGRGGSITATGDVAHLAEGARVSANGNTQGGSIKVGGDLQGQDTGLREATSTIVEEGASLSADATSGNAGQIIVWANNDTLFAGEATARARGVVGNGGFIEVSGEQQLNLSGMLSASSRNGKSGTVLLDPGNIVVALAGTAVGAGESLIATQFINNTLQGGTNVIVQTRSGSIEFRNISGGTPINGVNSDDRHSSIQWTNSEASFGAFAAGDIRVEHHIRTSGAGSISLMAGWRPDASDVLGDNDNPQVAWDKFLTEGKFGIGGGSVYVGRAGLARYTDVGSRFGNTNVAGTNVYVTAGSANQSSGTSLTGAIIGFRDTGAVFAPFSAMGGGRNLDLSRGAGATTNWYLSDGRSSAGVKPISGIGDPIVAVAGNAYGQEVDIDGDGIVDGVHGINSTGVLTDTFISYSNHYNSMGNGNWWWQQIDGHSRVTDAVYAANEQFGNLRPENGAGLAHKGADINVIATQDILLQAGKGSSSNAQIGHGGANWMGQEYNSSDRRTPVTTDPTAANFSADTTLGSQFERRWSTNGSGNDRIAVSIARLAPVYGNINVHAGVNTSNPITVNRQGPGTTITASYRALGDVQVIGNQLIDNTSRGAFYNHAMIGHGGSGGGSYYGHIDVQAGGNVRVMGPEGDFTHAGIGHMSGALAFWNLSSNQDQQIRFFASYSDIDNMNLFYGELFTGTTNTGFHPDDDPVRHMRYTVMEHSYDPATGILTYNEGNLTGNFVPYVHDGAPGSEGSAMGNFVGNGGTGTWDGKTWINLRVAPDDIYRFVDYDPRQYSMGSSGAGKHEGDPTAAHVAAGQTKWWANASGAAGLRDISQGRLGLAPLELSPESTATYQGRPITVEALDGSVATGYHGNITVKAHNGNVELNGFEYSQQTSIDWSRFGRFAMIGHGGSPVSTSGATKSGYHIGANPASLTPTGTANNALYFRPGGPENTGMRDDQPDGTSYSRYHTFMTITGDIRVEAGRDVLLNAGNDMYSYAKIGHGGHILADYETSSFIVGDIRVRAGNEVVLKGGQAPNYHRAGSFDMNAWAQIGHGGYMTGFFGYFGDIDVEAGGDIRLQGGAHSHTFAKIGHQGYTDIGQSGGDFWKNEHFNYLGVETFLESKVTEDEVSVRYTAGSRGERGPAGVTGETIKNFADESAPIVGVDGKVGTLVGAGRNTADVRVVSRTGDVILEHAEMGLRHEVGRRGVPAPGSTLNVESQTTGARTRNSYAQIGHGGLATVITAANLLNNSSSNFNDKVGDVDVLARLGSVIMRNGEGEQRWTRIGHGVAANERIVTAGWAAVLGGTITVEAGQDVILDAGYADENEKKHPDFGVEYGSTPSRLNPVVIGHGGVFANQGIVVLSNTEVNGLDVVSDVSVSAGNDVKVLGGKGTEASFAQIGH